MRDQNFRLNHYLNFDNMVTTPKSQEDQEDLNQRLRSLKIDRTPVVAAPVKARSPKLILLLVAVVLALVAFGYVFLFSGVKTISAASVTTDTGTASAGESVLTASGYVVAHHK